MEIKRLTNSFLIFGIIFFIILSCNSSKKIISVIIIDSVKISDTHNLYVYHMNRLLHTGSESYFAIGEDVCSLKDTSNTFAYTNSYTRIDSFVSNKIFISSSYNLKYIYQPDRILIDVQIIPIEETFKKNKFNNLVSMDSCR
jgi:hypothetical protein